MAKDTRQAYTVSCALLTATGKITTETFVGWANSDVHAVTMAEEFFERQGFRCVGEWTVAPLSAATDKAEELRKKYRVGEDI